MFRLPAVLMMALIVAAPGSHAQETEALQLPGEGDVRIIVDISGSMKANDPNNLRQPAVRLLARMIPNGAEAGVWTFGQWVNMLVSHGTVDDAWRDNAVSQSSKINSVALRTNLGEAIEKASDDYLSGEDLSNTDFILLTDGKVDLADDPSVNATERARILGPLLAGLTDRGATLHTIALSEEADLEMLEALAADSGGHFSLAATAEGLNRAFLKALNAAVPQDQIPLDEEGFTVDGGVEEFTALIFWGEDETSATRSLELVNPAGESFSKDGVATNMRWAAETGYDLVTVTEPAAGQWQVNGELGEGSRVTVVSDLRMVVSPVPPTFTANDPVALEIAFFEEDARIQNGDFLKVIDVIVRLTSSDGRSGSKTLNQGQPPEDGIYTDGIASLPAAGDYQLEVIADGTTFSRRFSAVTRFVAPESEQLAPEPEQQSGAPEPAPALESTDPINQPDASAGGPIDISNVEEPTVADPAPAPAPPKPAPTPAETGLPLWVWGAAGVAGVLILAGGVWFWLRRRKAASEQTEETEDESPDAEDEVAESEDDEPDLADEVEQEPEPEPEQEVSEVDSNEDGEEDIPELEPESEPEPEPEPEPQQESESEPEEPPLDEEDDDDDEFGLEDFDLSEFDDLPEDEDKSGDDDPKKGG